MGVLSCDRQGCNNIMCERHSYEHGYICNSCFEELVKEGIATDINEFMNIEKDLVINVIDSRDYFENIFEFNY